MLLVVGVLLRVRAQLHVPFDVVGLGVVVVAELDDRNGLQHGAGDPSGSTLPGASGSVARPVAFGVPVGADGAHDDDGQEESRDDAGDAVEDDHGGVGVVAGVPAVAIVHRDTLYGERHVGDDAAGAGTGGGRVENGLNGLRGVGGQDRKDVGVVVGTAFIRGVIAMVGLSGVQEYGCRLLLRGDDVGDGLTRIEIAGIGGWIATDEGDVSGLDSERIGGVDVEELPCGVESLGGVR